MPDLLALLGNAANSLTALRALTATASHNIQNASTPGYARQRMELRATDPAEQVNGAYIGRGVTSGAVQQLRDRFVENQLPAALSGAARSGAESEALQSLTALDPGAAGGIGSSLGAFYAALRAWAQNPADAGLRAATLGSAQTMARSFNRTAQSIESARSALDVKAQGVVDQINSEARAVAQLNVAIQRARTGGEPNDLLDQRQLHLDKLAELAGATTVPTSDGSVNVVLAGGQALVAGGSAVAISTEPDLANGRHLSLRLGDLGGGASQPLSASSLSGALGGLLAARDGPLADAGAQVDQLAFDLAGALDAAHTASYGLDGSNGRPLFDVGASASGAAAGMAVAITDPSQLAAAASAQGLPGDGSGAQALVDTESALLSGGRDAQSTLAALVSGYGAATQRAGAYAEQDVAIRDNLTSLRESASGVSIDEEMIEMQKSQRGYEAVIKVVQVADEMLQTLMQLR